MEQAKEKLREARIQQWFSMWLDAKIGARTPSARCLSTAFTR